MKQNSLFSVYYIIEDKQWKVLIIGNKILFYKIEAYKRKTRVILTENRNFK
jgi:hypothetical protein